MAKILIVEDNLSDQIMLKNMLEQLGHQVHCPSDTLNFEEYVLYHQPDLIIMDLNLRHRSGIVLIHDLKRTTTLAHIPIIVTTALPIHNIRSKLVQLGCSAFVDKPFYPPTLLETIDTILSSGFQSIAS